ncbi:MAG: diguanylate cyclase [Alphaproteobacteria bacterium]|nr:diguanylate cyclase [Alphaproteobacteria bacterium]
MQQNEKKPDDKKSVQNQCTVKGTLDDTELHLAWLAQQFPKHSAAVLNIQNSLLILKKINKNIVATNKNKGQMVKLKNEIAMQIGKIQDYIRAEKGRESKELNWTFQRLVENLQEHIILDYDPQETSTGTQFLHSIGFDQIVSMINAASLHEPEWMSRTGTLLVLDDNPNTSQALMRRLTREGHIVLNAATESEGFAYLRSHAVEAILVDYIMFQNKICDFLKKIEADHLVGYIPVIVIGAPENIDVMEKMTELGVGDYLAKPVNPTLLKMQVHAVLEKKYAFEQRVKRSQEMQRTRQELVAAIQDLPDGFGIFDQNNHLVMHNEKLFEYYPHLKHRDEMTRGGLTFEGYLEANLAAGIYLFENERARRSWIAEKKANFFLPASQWEESLSNGLVLGVTTYRTPDGGGALVVKDISQDKAHHQDLTFLAYHDSLTGLLNRKAFHQKLSQSIFSVKNSETAHFAVLFLDLDEFKIINDSHGHDMGDWLLNQVAQRLRRCLRGDDTLARFGGDEFCIILNYPVNRTKIKLVASRILKSISNPYIREGISMSVGVSIGIAIYSSGIEDSESLLKEADEAMYVVKQSGKGRFCFYDELLKSKSSSKPKPTKYNKNR